MMNLDINKFRITYYIFIFTILISLILKEIVVQYSINQQNTDAKIINLTGRQRMLSQRVSKVALFLSIKENQKLPDKYNFNTFKNLTTEWETTYKYIFDFSKTHIDKEIISLYKTNAVYHAAIIKSSKTYLNNPSKENNSKLIQVLAENELKFLISMEKIVSNYQKNAERKIERLRDIEFSLFVFTILLFLAELFLLVRPAFLEILKKNESITILNKDLQSSESDFRKANEVLSKLQEELVAKEKLNKIFIEQSPNATAMFDYNLNYLAVSDKWVKDYQLKGSDIIGKNHYEIFPEIGDDWKKIHKECLKGAIHKGVDTEFIRLDGTKQWINWDIKPWYKTDEEIGGILIYTDDITLIKESDKEKSRIEEILNKASEVARIGTWEVDLINSSIYWSKVTKEIHEVTSDFVPDLEKGINFYKEGNSRDTIQKVVGEAIQNGTSFDIELEIVTAKNRVNWVRSIGQAKMVNGKCVGLYGVFQDINKIKTTEVALNNVNHELNAIFDASPISIIGTSINGTITHFNKGAEKMLQYSAAEVINKLTPVIIHKKSEIITRQKELSAFYQKEISGFDVFVEAAKNNLAESRKWTYIKKDGSELPVELTVIAIKDLYNNITGFLGLATDYSERLKTEIETIDNLKRLTNKLTVQNKQLVSFAHITSHNLRAPVGNLNALLSFYKMEELAEEKESLMVKFGIVINHLTNTLDTLVDTLKIKEASDIDVKKLIFKEIYDKTIETLVGQIMESEAEITSDFSKVPDIVYNQTYLESIFLNLLSNAIRYRDESRKPKIFVETMLINKKAVLKVHDNGLGINLERNKDKLFGLNKTFHRNASAKGIGLYLTKTQIEAMGGNIYAQSEVNRGSTFVIEF